MDDHSFYGGFLHVTYAPESESIQHTREKLQQRRMDVARRLRKLAQERAPDVDDSKLGLFILSSVTSADTVYPMLNEYSCSGLESFMRMIWEDLTSIFAVLNSFIHTFFILSREISLDFP